jgi:hypothetical protein
MGACKGKMFIALALIIIIVDFIVTKPTVVLTADVSPELKYLAWGFKAVLALLVVAGGVLLERRYKRGLKKEWFRKDRRVTTAMTKDIAIFLSWALLIALYLIV